MADPVLLFFNVLVSFIRCQEWIYPWIRLVTICSRCWCVGFSMNWVMPSLLSGNASFLELYFKLLIYKYYLWTWTAIFEDWSPGISQCKAGMCTRCQALETKAFEDRGLGEIRRYSKSGETKTKRNISKLRLETDTFVSRPWLKVYSQVAPEHVQNDAGRFRTTQNCFKQF